MSSNNVSLSIEVKTWAATYTAMKERKVLAAKAVEDHMPFVSSLEHALLGFERKLTQSSS